MRSLYWKICVTFLVVVATSLAAGRMVFHLAMPRMMPPRHHENERAVGELVAALIASAGREGASLAEAGRRAIALIPEKSHLRVSVSTTPPPVEMPAIEHHPHDHRPVAVPCAAGGERGWVMVAGGPPGPPDDFWPMIVQASGAAVATVFCMSALLGLVVFRFLTSRLRQLQDCVAGLARGQLSLRVTSPGPDEIGDVGRSLNTMAERLQRVVGELEENDRRRRDLLADISHELKTPLTVLRGHLEQALDGRGPAEQAQELWGNGVALGATHSIEVAFAESDRLALLIDDLLELARLQASEFRLNRKEVVLQRVVQKALARFELAAERRRVKLSAQLAEEPIRIVIDHRRIEQVVANLVQNALKSVSDGGSVQVVVSEGAAGPTVEILDDGRGMSPDEIDHAFDRFRTGTVDHGSTGLGLSIVKQLVEAHGGTVKLEARAEKGIRAVVTL